MSDPQKIEEKDLEVPRETLGLHILHPPKNSSIVPDVDIIAVHGLGGDSYSTWTSNKTLWLRDLLPKSAGLKNARIMTFGYDARAFVRPFEKSTHSTGRTFTFAEALLNDLADKRASAAAKNRPIIFIGHSLGGIVIKDALRHAHGRSSMYGNILNSTTAIVFFGTPHQGADAAVWASYLGKIGRGIGLRSTQVTAELQRWSIPLVELTTMFSELAPDFRITTFFEKLPTHGVTVVPEGSARMGVRNERIRGLDADHLSICKMTEENPNWSIVQARFEAIAEEELVPGSVQRLPDPVRTQPDDETLGRRMEALRR